MQDFEPLYVQLRGKNTHPGRVAPRSCQTGREPAAHHVIGHGDDRDGRSRALRRASGGVAEGDNEIDVLRDKFASQRRRALSEPLGPKEQEADVAPLFPADCFHIASERLGEGL
jgi:hypothetical protein